MAKKIENAPSGEKTSSDGTEKLPISGSQWMLVSRIKSWIFGSDVSFNSHKATNVSDPTSAQDAATKNYVDGLAANIGKRQRVRAATTATITISTALNNADTLDGVTLATGDLVLVKDQSAPEQNGIYVVGVSPARFSEFDTYDEHPGSLIAVQEGTANEDTLWLCTSNVGGTLNTTAIDFAAFTGSGGSGDVATDTIWNALGDLAAGTGSDTAARLAVGTDGQILYADSGEATGLLWDDPPSGGAGAVTFITELTPSGTGTASFTSISGSYKHLVIEYVIRSTKSADYETMNIQLNTDSTAGNYRNVRHFVYGGGSIGTDGGDANSIDDVTASTGFANAASRGRVDIPFYTETTFQKQVNVTASNRRDTSGVGVIMFHAGVEWENTAAITQVDFVLPSGNFVSGSILRLYGVT